MITILHFVELGSKPASKERTVAIMDETSSVVTYVSRLLSTPPSSAASAKTQQTKLGFATIMGVTSVIHGGIPFSVAASKDSANHRSPEHGEPASRL